MKTKAIFRHFNPTSRSASSDKKAWFNYPRLTPEIKVQGLSLGLIPFNLIVLMTISALIFGCENTGKSDESSVLAERKEALDTINGQVVNYLEGCPWPYEELSEGEIEALFFMREEEKLARDTYLELYDIYGLRNLGNISKSEQVHMNAILHLIDKYELTDPVGENERGVFQNEDLQELYDELLERGKTSKIEALKVGALIEETDILDIQKELDEVVDNKDIRFVFENLIRASGFHLKSFVGVLRLNGVDYEPVLMDESTYLGIIGD